MFNFYPHKPIKGKAFDLPIFYMNTTSNSERGVRDEDTGPHQVVISKDDGDFVEVTNTPQYINHLDSTFNGGYGHYVLTLTADEMNADKIIISAVVRNFQDTSNESNYFDTIINTVPDELTSVPDKDSSLSEKITAIFQYLIFKRTIDVSEEKMFKSDSTTELGSASVADTGSTVTKGKMS